ncbi:FHA domain-containing protein [Leucobacter sp. wl10]|uniref:FHA domain-containing protein n=1 Tax=Leucobacter sp. wl10 TaxID=2304677 RepID=UPI000E5A21EE|nr:FHA domain-containing protein [Leucobacter sp. wl10]RGE19084.1 FHA domain-containing protein [Leucobacter sp. wl10]
MTPKIPAYPVIHATVAADGSAHVAVAGDHRDYPAGSLEATREHIISYAVEVATRLGRGVRMTTVDPGGRWQLAVFPDGDVQPLEQAASRRRGRGAPTEPIPTMTPVAPAPVVQPQPHPVAPHPVPRAVATLRFTTGDVAVVADRAIIGRQPEAAPEEAAAGWQQIEVIDTGKTMSRVHAEVAWNGGRFWLIDRGSGNGTILYPESGARELRAGEPVEVVDGDTIAFGPVVRATVSLRWEATP